MGSSFIASGVTRKVALVLAAALTVALAISLGSVAESSAGETHAVAAKKAKCKKKGKTSAVAAKKCKRKVAAPVVVPAPPAPLALTDAEVINRVGQKAAAYCSVDPDCFDSGYYFDSDPAHAACSSKSTYSWTCYGWNDEDNGADPVFTCDFREVVERDGYNGIKSHQDLSFGINGWDCLI